ncbi:MAG: acetyl/propionyl/methylcrotonyl-CoA carboxylase subunit alpha [Bacillus sp. (in: firmicutes)]
MFMKLLIANRGEIASRIIRTTKKMGIVSVAVYSEADAGAPYVEEADEAYLLGQSRPQESYNNIDKIIAIAKTAGCEAIHPGYGFVSENPEFAERCRQEGIVFIGPSSDVIALMGKKIEARQTMEKAGLPVVPGISFPVEDVEEAALSAEKIGYPIMIKASAGGGGIGMGAVTDEAELRKTFEGHKRRAQSFFGNGDMYLERRILNPRHIEVQLLADAHGNVIHLWERECSVQRRNQKVIEEAPSPFVTEEKRNEICQAAVKAAKAIGYTNAGTIEFIMDENQQFYFLEMNTRLQVEHPVTEEITDIDLVEWQIKVAAGERLLLSQEDIGMEGHAIEARLYAEDPMTFYPSPGTITEFAAPDGEGIRHEVGVKQGGAITPFYDGMFAKLIVKGENRDQCIERLQKALESYKVSGVKTNIPMVEQVIAHPVFKEGNTTTAFVDQFYINKEGSQIK